MQQNPFHAAPTAEPMSLASAALDAAPAGLVTLRRSGARPVVFQGRELAHVMSFRVGTPLWYELNVFQAEDGRYVGDVRMFTKSPDEQDTFTVVVADSLDEVCGFFEGYDVSRDVASAIDFDDPSQSLSDLTFQALGLRTRVLAAEQQYKCLVTELFSEMEAMLGNQVVELYAAA